MRTMCCLIILCLMAIVVRPCFSVNNEPAPQERITTQEGKQIAPDRTRISDIRSFWELTKLGGGIRWAIFFVMIFGIFLIIQKLTELLLDKLRSKDILKAKLYNMDLVEIDNIVNGNHSTISELFSLLLNVLRTTGSTRGFVEEISKFIQLQQDRFSTFRTRMTFLSDTAGALGLLGTVWGIFQTFFGGTLDNQVILNGMGIALITTLMGLVVSIVLNLCSTEVYSFFNKTLDLLSAKSDEFRFRLMQIEQTSVRRTPVGTEVDEGTASEAFVEEGIAEKINITAISGNGQSEIVNKKLRHPFIVEVTDANQRKLKGETVIFSVEDDTGSFDNGERFTRVLTDERGRAQTVFKLGERIGQYNIRATTARSESSVVEFTAMADAGPAAKLLVVTGNNQTAPAGTPLRDPLVVEVRDSFDNAIKGCIVTFHVSLGEGYFPNGKRKCEVQADVNGHASTEFVLGSEPGFNSVVAEAKGLKNAQLEFKALGQEHK